jgi:catechol 2,3-dioxygenase-like lactoylglutathione lyase family enzyme
MPIRRAVPDIQTDRIEESRSFYADLLGFEVAMDMGWIVGLRSPDTPEAQIQLITADATAEVTPQISVEVGDVDEIHRRVVQAGHEILHPLTDEPWGVRRFFVRDPSGAVVNVMGHSR